MTGRCVKGGGAQGRQQGKALQGRQGRADDLRAADVEASELGAGVGQSGDIAIVQALYGARREYKGQQAGLNFNVAAPISKSPVGDEADLDLLGGLMRPASK